METDSRLDAIEKRIRRLEELLAANSQIIASPQVRFANEKLFLHSIDTLANEVKLSDQPQFYVGSISLTPIDLPSIFERRSPAITIFDYPHQVRDNGFGLYSTDHESAAIDVNSRTVKFNSQIRRITRDGKFSALFRGDDNFLGWAVRQAAWAKDQEALNSEWRINSLVLIEATYQCVKLVKEIFALAVPPAIEAQFLMGYRNLLWNGKGPKLLKGKADRNMLMRQQIPSDKGDHLSSVISSASETTERTTFRLVSEVYHLFGLMDEDVPYSAVTDEGRVINPADF
jgi:hypothetical protein